MCANTAPRPAVSRRARRARSIGPSTGPSTSTRTSATAAGTASPRVRSASSRSTTTPAPRRSARSATTGSTTASSTRSCRSDPPWSSRWAGWSPSGDGADRGARNVEPGLLKSADWPALIDVYFFLGGIAGGAFVIATIANLLDGERYRDVVRIGYYIAFLAVTPGPILLTVDFGVPTRFLHMLMVSKPSLAIGMDAVTVGPFHLNPFSPMNAGAW